MHYFERSADVFAILKKVPSQEQNKRPRHQRRGASAPRHPRQRDFCKKVEAAGTLARSCYRRLLRCKSPLDCLLIACDPNRGCREATGVRKFISANGKSPAAKAELFLVCGDGRTRTAVQTPHQRAFYTLSLPLVFDERLPGDRLSCAYPLNLNGA